MTTGIVVLQITVPGKPEPQGSVKTFVPTRRDGQPVRRPDGSIVVNVTTDNPALKAWREAIAAAALAARESAPPLGECALAVELTSYVKRPDAHCGTGRNEGVVKDHAPAYPIVRPDADKLLRAVLDALTEVAFADDGQVVDAVTRKRYAESPDRVRAEIVVRLMPAQSFADTLPQLELIAGGTS